MKNDKNNYIHPSIHHSTEEKIWENKAILSSSTSIQCQTESWQMIIYKKRGNKIDNGWKWNMWEIYSKFRNSMVIVAMGRLKRWHIHTQKMCWKCKKRNLFARFILSLTLLIFFYLRIAHTHRYKTILPFLGAVFINLHNPMAKKYSEINNRAKYTLHKLILDRVTHGHK